MGTPLTIQLITQLPLEGILDDIMSVVLLQERLDLLHQLVVELICIRLHHWIDRCSFVCYEGFTELAAVDAAVVAVFQTSKDLLVLKDLIATR